MKQIAYIGSWGKITPDNPLGIRVFEYEDGKFTQIGQTRSDIRIGCMSIEGDILYSTDEGKDYKGAPNGGGRVFSFSIGKDGNLTETSWSPSFGVFPCYFGFSIDKKYMVLANHSTNKGFITKTAFIDGEYKVVAERSESNVVLYRLNEDGTIGKAVDIVSLLDIDGEKQPLSLPHFLRRLPDKDIFLVVENGADRIYRFVLDEENEKLRLIEGGSFKAEPDSNPRYFATSPDFTYMYVVDEKRPNINTLKVDPSTGEMKQIKTQRMIPEDQPIVHPGVGAPASISPSDVIIDAAGKYVYAACRGTDTLTVFEVGDDHLLTEKQIINCGGHNPRSLGLDPEGKYLYSCNMDASLLSKFKVLADGTLEKLEDMPINCPGFIRFRKA